MGVEREMSANHDKTGIIIHLQELSQGFNYMLHKIHSEQNLEHSKCSLSQLLRESHFSALYFHAPVALLSPTPSPPCDSS